jgi:DNA repair exonuclease SbcCD ATPase subunit
MSYHNYRGRRPAITDSSSNRPAPTQADYIALAQAYDELKARVEEQSKAFHNTKTELEIKNEALHRQTDDIKKLEAELLFTRAGLEEAQKQLDEGSGQEWQEK